MTSLSVVDYLVLTGMLVVCAAIGIYHAFRGTSTHSGREYFLGSRRISPFPVAVSLVVSVMSAVTYIGTPADVYIHGPKFGLMCLNKVIVAFVVTTVMLPVFYRLEVTSVYEYLDRRFNKVVRYGVVTLEMFFSTMYLGIVVYAPALALSTVTDLNLTLSVLSIGIVCTFYTTVGGIKAVIWTDVFQAAVMMLGFILMIIVGTLRIGGVGEGWHRAKEGDRSQLVDFGLDPTIRLSFWSIFIGGSLFSISAMGTKQSVVQRYNSCSSERNAKMAAWMGILGLGVVEIAAVATGMTMYGYYRYCDPLSEGRVGRPDQLIPLFIMDLFQSIPGLPGILLGGAFCASLSTMSSILNGLAAITGRDFIKVFWDKMPEAHYLLAVKGFSIIYGVLSILVAFLVPSLGKVLQITLTLGGIFGGPVLGVFCLGMIVRRANSISALVGLIFGVLIGVTFQVGSLLYPPSSAEGLPLSVDSCPIIGGSNVTLVSSSIEYGVLTTPSDIAEADVFEGRLFGISFLHYTTLTSLTTILVGFVVSFLPFGEQDEVDKSLLSPFVQGFYSSVYEGEAAKQSGLRDETEQMTLVIPKIEDAKV